MFKFTPAQRKAIYSVAVAFGTALMVFGVVNPEMLNALTVNLDAISGLITTLIGVLAVLNINKDE